MKKIKTSTLLFVLAVVIVSAIFGANIIQQEKLIADKDASSSISSYDEFVSMHNKMYADPELDSSFEEEFLAYHTEYIQGIENPGIEFIGVIYSAAAPTHVIQRVYHLLDDDGRVVAHFYGHTIEGRLTHLGWEESTFSRLIRKAYAVHNGYFDIRVQRDGLILEVLVQEGEGDNYRSATILDSEFTETAFDNLRP